MHYTRIIPCLDVDQGRVVKGTNFENLCDAGDPIEWARIYDAQGADELVFLDITASHEKRAAMFEVVEKTADACFIPLTVGGGVRKIEDVRSMLLAGADKVSVNTAAIKNPNLLNASAESFGSQCIVVAIDARSDGDGGWIVYTHGGRIPTTWQAVDWAVEVEKRGAGEIIITSIDTDGTQEGYNLLLTATISDAVGIPVIASGGAGTIDHITDVLTIGKADAVLAASIFHFGHYTISDVKCELASRGIPVRRAIKTKK